MKKDEELDVHGSDEAHFLDSDQDDASEYDEDEAVHFLDSDQDDGSEYDEESINTANTSTVVTEKNEKNEVSTKETKKVKPSWLESRTSPGENPYKRFIHSLMAPSVDGVSLADTENEERKFYFGGFRRAILSVDRLFYDRPIVATVAAVAAIGLLGAAVFFGWPVLVGGLGVAGASVLVVAITAAVIPAVATITQFVNRSINRRVRDNEKTLSQASTLSTDKKLTEGVRQSSENESQNNVKNKLQERPKTPVVQAETSSAQRRHSFSSPSVISTEPSVPPTQRRNSLSSLPDTNTKSQVNLTAAIPKSTATTHSSETSLNSSNESSRPRSSSL